MSDPLRIDDEARCERCSFFSPLDLGDRRLCEDCYHLCGSCCPEFGADDLWPREDPPTEAPAKAAATTDEGGLDQRLPGARVVSSK